MFLRSLLAPSFLGVSLAAATFSGMITTGYASAAIPAPTVPLKLMTVAVQGNHQVPTADILQAFGYHAGDTVTRNDLAAAQKRVGALYSSRNVGASLGEQMKISDKGISVKLILEEQAAGAAAQPTALVLDKVEFQGNRKVTTAELEAATKLRAGGPVSNEQLSADQQAIQALYKSKNVGASFQPQATYPNHDQHVVLIWQIHEQDKSAN
ncbi:FtsQ-type POTRA domain-containing protein [Gluconobacter roseus]|uniref:POTRA domain-containing protein n=1 Tax=Gluconobacter roseus NBRC 3990 TaxID=1307950 RepID=A0A4Y3M6Y1_9PROT|nr:FtsQ-type POTRA domain-containing protein [Gluconobacter roseus]GBR46556.1 surface antigen protein [Gluconobacter roseus NBRC 3990]GEB05010.1 hypothetical protein GRO01_25860 [Gluconobacter roseus NBRC 3990]GLP94669.1 hypothetical protein GCM10007871_26470 [Gluconobacter roseus NBRC 3990]